MQDVFKRRRAQVQSAIGPGLLLLPAAPTAIRNRDVSHEYRQDSDFFYLTGFIEPESLLVLSSEAPPGAVLFVRPRDPEREVWDGLRLGVEGAVEQIGVDAAFPISELDARLPELIRNVPRVFYRLGQQRNFDEMLLSAIDRVKARARLGVIAPDTVIDPITVLGEMRVRKDSEEIELMRKAVAITGEAHLAAMARAGAGMREYQLDALLRGIFRDHGSERPAYTPIVGSGPNATILHYHAADRCLQDGELVLIDAGCEYGYYAADVTRTFPVNGRFSKPQREIYEIVLAAQLACIEAIRPGVTFEELDAIAARIITEQLIELGLLAGPLELALEERRYKPFFMHRTGHYLGMDVHDVGSYFKDGKPRGLEPGMVVTVEPGIYIAATAAGVASEYLGIGVRIEDDILVTSEGACVLSADIPKRVVDVERACRG